VELNGLPRLTAADLGVPGLARADRVGRETVAVEARLGWLGLRTIHASRILEPRYPKAG
jgi:hypothetical protein